jgi:hypothetical protein
MGSSEDVPWKTNPMMHLWLSYIPPLCG